MSFLLDNCRFVSLEEVLSKQSTQFDCGHDDLNDFFANESMLYSKQLLGKSYCFVLEENPSVAVCAFTVSNDSIKVDVIPGSRKKKVSEDIPRTKQMKRYPAVLIGRLGVSKDFKRHHIGTELMDFIKYWFVSPQNKTGCRFIVVDSYNEEEPLKYYEKNGFKFLFSSEEQEAIHTGMKEGERIETRLMYFDLIKLEHTIRL